MYSKINKWDHRGRKRSKHSLLDIHDGLWDNQSEGKTKVGSVPQETMPLLRDTTTIKKKGRNEKKYAKTFRPKQKISDTLSFPRVTAGGICAWRTFGTEKSRNRTFLLDRTYFCFSLLGKLTKRKRRRKTLNGGG